MSIISVNSSSMRIACPGALLSSGYNAVEYHQVTGLGFVPYVYVWSNSTALMKVEITSGLSGYLMGLSGAMYIAVSSGTGLTFVSGGNTYSHAIETGTHIIGFADGQAYYDGKKTSWSITSAYKGSYFGFGCLATSSGGVSNPATLSGGALKVHRILGVFGMDDAGTYSGRTYAWMPSVNTSTGKSRMWQTQPYAATRDLQWKDTSASEGTVTSGSTVTYGVNMEDLKEAFGGSYRDLIMQHCEDGGTALSSYEGPDTLTTTSGSTTVTHSSAFALSDITVGGVRSNSMSVPSGVTWKTWGTNKGYSKGDLIVGRKPKWSLWADGINVGKHLYAATAGGSGSYCYNIFHPKNQAETPNLEQWEGYTTGSANAHAPFIDVVNGTYTTYWNNGVPFRCVNSEAYRLPIVVASGSGTSRGDYMIWTQSANGILNVHAAWGNLIDWHDSLGLPYYIGSTRQGYAQVTQVGITVTVTIGGDPRPIAQYYINSSEDTSGSTSGFGSGTSAAFREKIQSGKQDGSLINWALTERRDLFDDAYNRFLESATVPSAINLYLASPSVAQGGLIDLVDYVGQPLSSVSAVFNETIGTNDTGFRLILDTPSVGSYLVRNGVADNNGDSMAINRQETQATTHGVGMFFTLCTAGGNKRAANTEANRVLVVGDFYVCDASDDSVSTFSRYSQLAGLTALAKEAQLSSRANDEYYLRDFEMYLQITKSSDGGLRKAKYADGTEVGDDYSVNTYRIMFKSSDIMGSDDPVPATTTARFSMYTDKCAFFPWIGSSGAPFVPQAGTPCFYKYVSSGSLSEYLFFQPVAKPVSGDSSDFAEIYFQRYSSLSAGSPKDTGASPESPYPSFTLNVQEVYFNGNLGNTYSGTWNETTGQISLKYGTDTGFYAQLSYETHESGGYMPDGTAESMGLKHWCIRLRQAAFTALKTYRYWITA